MALTPYLPPGIRIIHAGNWLMFERGGQPAWMYAPSKSDGSTYTLSIKLGWDPRLVGVHDAKGTRWEFVPGDGSEEKPVILTP